MPSDVRGIPVGRAGSKGLVVDCTGLGAARGAARPDLTSGTGLCGCCSRPWQAAGSSITDDEVGAAFPDAADAGFAAAFGGAGADLVGTYAVEDRCESIVTGDGSLFIVNTLMSTSAALIG